MAACSLGVHTQELLQDLDLDGIWVRDPWRLERHCDVAPGGPGIETVGPATSNSSAEKNHFMGGHQQKKTLANWLNSQLPDEKPKLYPEPTRLWWRNKRRKKGGNREAGNHLVGALNTLCISDLLLPFRCIFTATSISHNIDDPLREMDEMDKFEWEVPEASRKKKNRTQTRTRTLDVGILVRWEQPERLEGLSWLVSRLSPPRYRVKPDGLAGPVGSAPKYFAASCVINRSKEIPGFIWQGWAILFGWNYLSKI